MDDLIKALKELSSRDEIYGVERLVKQAQKLFPDARNLRQAATEALKTNSKNRFFQAPRQYWKSHSDFSKRNLANRCCRFIDV